MKNIKIIYLIFLLLTITSFVSCGKNETAIKIKCPVCGTLSDENSIYCENTECKYLLNSSSDSSINDITNEESTKIDENTTFAYEEIIDGVLVRFYEDGSPELPYNCSICNSKITALANLHWDSKCLDCVKCVGCGYVPQTSEETKLMNLEKKLCLSCDNTPQPSTPDGAPENGLYPLFSGESPNVCNICFDETNHRFCEGCGMNLSDAQMLYNGASCSMSPKGFAKLCDKCYEYNHRMGYDY